MYVVIAGGGLVGGELARKLLANKHDVVVIDSDRDTCDKLYTEMGLVAVCGCAARIDVLQEAGIDKADIVVAATPEDSENLACAILAKSMDVHQIIVRMRNPDYQKAYDYTGVNAVVSVTDLMVDQIIMKIENPKVQRVAAIGNGSVNIFLITVPEGAKVAGMTICEVAKNPKFPQACIFIAVYSRKKGQISRIVSDHVFGEGDEILLTVPVNDVKRVVDILTAV